MQKTDIFYQAADYLRLSKEDGDFSISSGKQESNSISSQRELIRQFVRNTSDIELVAEFCDDGYTGTNFDRPDFKAMMDAVKAGKINCIIVKDLSRFGRDYIESGKYIEKIFPQLGVRFIAINDHYDSAVSNGSDSIILPFKNLINDSYSRDISIKVRSNLEIKRRRGEFIANFPVYGYARSPEDKNRLVVDDFAAVVVRDIFRWRIEGLSTQKIADRLNQRGTLSPMEYKRANGSNYASCFKTNYHSAWSAVSISRILSNVVYTGTLAQGRRTTPNYKVKKVIVKDESDWVCIENAHEAIISMAEFHLVQELSKSDSRSAPGSASVHPLSGKVFCAQCGRLAKRSTVSSNGRKYAYYNCPDAVTGSAAQSSSHSSEKDGCVSRRISEKELDAAVLATLQAQISLIMDMEQALAQIDELAWEKREVKRLEAEIAMQEEVVEKNNSLKVGTYEDLRDGLITKDEYSSLKDQFAARVHEAEEAILRLKRECDTVKESLGGQQGWLSQFRKYQNVTCLDRTLIVNLVERILLYPNRQIKVRLRHSDQFADILEFLQAQDTSQNDASTKEAV